MKIVTRGQRVMDSRFAFNRQDKYVQETDKEEETDTANTASTTLCQPPVL